MNLINGFEEFMFDVHVFNDGFDDNVRFFNNTSQIRWSLQTR